MSDYSNEVRSSLPIRLVEELFFLVRDEHAIIKARLKPTRKKEKRKNRILMLFFLPDISLDYIVS